MKKIILVIMVLSLTMGVMVGCTKKVEPVEQEVVLVDSKPENRKEEEPKVEETKVEEPKKEEPKKEEPKTEEPKKEEPKKEEPKKEEPKKEEPKKEETKVEESKFKNDNGILTYLDTKNSPFDGLGVKIIINKATSTAKFIKTDLDGNEGADYYTFNFENNTFKKYYFVSAMGNGYFYYYNLADKALIKVEDKDGKDVTQSMKDGGRWDGAVTNVENDISTLQDYFIKESKTSIKDFVLDK